MTRDDPPEQAPDARLVDELRAPAATENASEVGPSEAAAPAASFAKPNLILKDPDPYAFANRIRRLTFVLAALSLLICGPYLVRHFVYHVRYAQLKADHDYAGEALEGRTKSAFAETSQLVAKRIGPSVVSIQTPGFRSAEGQGSGVIVDPEGFIVTNFHVIAPAVRGNIPLSVKLEDGRSTYGQIIGVDAATDLAVIKVKLPDLIAAEWGESDALRVGDLVWAAGSPFGLDSSVTFGIVSAKERRSEDGVTDQVYQEYLQTDVAVNPGNSGGPLVDNQGKVVGINTAIIGRSYRGISFAIPTTLAKRQYERLRKDGWVERGYLGVTPELVPDVIRLRLNLEPGEGVHVAETLRPGPADDAGIRRGDVILSWNGTRADDPTLLRRVIALTEVGSTADVVVKRLVGGKPVELSMDVKVGVRSLNNVRLGR